MSRFAELSMRDYFCFRRKEFFEIDPSADPQDAAVYFGQHDVLKRIEDKILEDYRMNRAPFFIMYGPPGSGKTHLLRHIGYRLRTDERFTRRASALCLYIETITWNKKEDDWATIHESIINALSYPVIRAAINQFQEKQRGNIIEPLMRIFRGTNISLNLSLGEVIRKAGLDFDAAGVMGWLKGRGLAKELKVETELERLEDYVDVLINLSNLFYNATGQKLVILWDEAQMMKDLSEKAGNDILAALKVLSNEAQRNLGIVMTALTEQGATRDSLPGIMNDNALMRRLRVTQENAYRAYIDLQNVISDETGVQNFVKKAIEYVVDPQKAKATVEMESLATSADLFPLSPDGFDQICVHVAEAESFRLPFYILQILERCFGEAYDRRYDQEKHVLINADLVSECVG